MLVARCALALEIIRGALPTRRKDVRVRKGALVLKPIWATRLWLRTNERGRVPDGEITMPFIRGHVVRSTPASGSDIALSNPACRRGGAFS
jgi:hypothetical protein